MMTMMMKKMDGNKMSFKRIQKIVEDNYDIHEDSLQSVLDDLHNSLQTLDTIIGEEGMSQGASESISERAKLVKQYLIQAIRAGRDKIEEDGTMADLGTLPKLPLSVVDAGGTSRDLMGIGATKKLRTHKKRRKHEGSDPYEEDDETAEEDEHNFERREHDKELDDYLKAKKKKKKHEGQGDFGGGKGPSDAYNSLVRLIKDPSIEDSVKREAKSLLSDLNTAGGSNMIGKEVNNFLSKQRAARKEV